MLAPLSVARSHGIPSTFGFMGLLFALALERGGARPQALAVGAVAFVILATRIVFRIEPQRGECRVLLTLAAMPVLALRRVNLSTVQTVEITAEVRTSKHGSRVVYPVSVIGERELRLWPLGDALAARRLGERLARALGSPLRDGSNGTAACRAPEELNMSLGQRLRHRRRTPEPGSLPARSGIRVRQGTETVVEFPAQRPPFWILLFALGIAAALGAIFWSFVPFPNSVIPLGFILFVAGAFSFGFAMTYRPTFLTIGRNAIETRGQIGRGRRIEFARLEEVLEGDADLQLVADDARLGVPYSFADERERRFVVDLIERAAYDHQSALAPIPDPAASLRAVLGATGGEPSDSPALAPGDGPPGRSTPTIVERAVSALHRPIMPWFPGVFCIIVGGAQLSFALYLAQADWAFAERAESTRGTVVNITPSGSPVVRFRTAGGDEVTFRDSASSSPPSYAVGESVEVLYDRRRPAEARVPGVFRQVAPLAVGLFGLTFFTFGLGMLWRLRRQRRRASARSE